MIKVGVTGGIGSGKTVFCDFLEQQGAFVIHADDLAKELMVTNPSLIKQIKEVFGEEAYKDGKLNRAYLANEAFAKGRVEELNALVHPAIWDKTGELVQQKEEEGVKVFVEEAAILLNNGRPEWLDVVIILTAPEDQRIRRVIERDTSEEQEVVDRMNKQPDFEALYSLADFTVENTGSLDELKEKAEKIYNSLIKKGD